MPPDGARPAPGRMQRFAGALLGASGALVEAGEGDALDVLAPPPVQEALGVGELARLSFGAEARNGRIRVGIESDWLERFGRLLGNRGRTLWVRPDLTLRPPADPAGLLAAGLALDNATFRLLGAEPALAHLLVFEFRFTALADEKRDGLLRLGLNLATGALYEDSGELERLFLECEENEAGTLRHPENGRHARAGRKQVMGTLLRALAPRLERAITPFVKGLRRRLERDQERLYTYHNDLTHEAARRLAAMAPGDAARAREEERLAAIVREYEGRLDDLARQYALRVTLLWTQTLDVLLPVQRFSVQLRRRKAERMIALDWNPLTRRLEVPACEWSFGVAAPRLLCDEALHLLSPDGLAPCSGCGRPFCRACYPDRCPKCGATVAPRALGLAVGSERSLRQARVKRK